MDILSGIFDDQPRFLAHAETWHLQAIALLALLFSFVKDLDLHRRGWGLLMKIGFTHPGGPLKKSHDEYWGLAIELVTRLMTYIFVLGLCYLAMMALVFGI